LHLLKNSFVDLGVVDWVAGFLLNVIFVQISVNFVDTVHNVLEPLLLDVLLGTLEALLVFFKHPPVHVYDLLRVGGLKIICAPVDFGQVMVRAFDHR